MSRRRNKRAYMEAFKAVISKDTYLTKEQLHKALKQAIQSSGIPSGYESTVNDAIAKIDSNIDNLYKQYTDMKIQAIQKPQMRKQKWYDWGTKVLKFINVFGAISNKVMEKGSDAATDVIPGKLDDVIVEKIVQVMSKLDEGARKVNEYALSHSKRPEVQEREEILDGLKKKTKEDEEIFKSGRYP